MLRDIARFYREAPAALHQLGEARLDEYLRTAGFGAAFCEDHLYPMIAAIWSTPAGQAGALPAASFIRFCENHGLLRMTGRPAWRTVTGGSREYVSKLRADFRGQVMTRRPVVGLREIPGGVALRDALGVTERFDEVVLAMHADQALRLLEDATPEERRCTRCLPLHQEQSRVAPGSAVDATPPRRLGRLELCRGRYIG